MIIEKLKEDMKAAMKAGDSGKLGTVRMLVAAVNNRGIEKRGKGDSAPLTDEEVMDVLIKEAKKRSESIDIYKQNNREELAATEAAELKIIQEYLPQQLSSGEIEKIIDEAVKTTGATTLKDLGKVMGLVSKETKGRADSRAISEIIKKKLGI